MLVGLRLLRLRRARLRVVSHLDLQGCWRAFGFFRAPGVQWLWGLQCWPNPLPSPLNQRYSITDGFSHDLHITLMEES